MRYTKEEISLCKQVAEKHKKKVGRGDWYLLNNILVLSVFPVGEEKAFYSASSGRIILLWTISDCLGFLRGKYAHVHINTHPKACECYIGQSGGQGTHDSFSGKTPLEACLKAVLAVLEEVK